MQVTFTNATSDILAIAAFYRSLAASESITVSMTAAQYDQELGLKTLVEDGSLTIDSIVAESGDSSALSAVVGPSYDDAGRPAATTVPLFSAIWNTDDGAPNYSDGTNWVDSAGVTT